MPFAKTAHLESRKRPTFPDSVYRYVGQRRQQARRFARLIRSAAIFDDTIYRQSLPITIVSAALWRTKAQCAMNKLSMFHDKFQILNWINRSCPAAQFVSRTARNRPDKAADSAEMNAPSIRVGHGFANFRRPAGCRAASSEPIWAERSDGTRKFQQVRANLPIRVPERLPRGLNFPAMPKDCPGAGNVGAVRCLMRLLGVLHGAAAQGVP